MHIYLEITNAFRFPLIDTGIAMYLMLWPDDGIMRKEDIRRVFDGSIFYEIAARRERNANVAKKVY